MKKHIIIIGSGFSSLSAAAYLAKDGFKVTILEKNKLIGGRARQLKVDGFTFDMGPSFYWMPDVFDSFFNDFSKSTKEYYKLLQLDPGYEVFFGKNDSVKVAANFDQTKDTFEKIERGSSKKLQNFIDSAEDNYITAIKDLVFQPGENILEIITPKTFLKLNLFFQTIKKQVHRNFKNERLKKILEFPVLFLGAKPSNTPAFYNFMNYADLKLGTWHPEGGMFEVINAMISLNEELGVNIINECNVSKIGVNNFKQVEYIQTNQGKFYADIILSGADYWHTEKLLPDEHRQYSDNYWNSRTFAPSALIFYIGFDKKLKNVSHHSLFFDTDFEEHASAIYDKKNWPDQPLFYASFPSITDAKLAPKGNESGVFLIPLAPGIEDNDQIREQYFKKIITRFEKITNQEVQSNILFKKSYCIKDFESDYNAYKGNAYGLANTLFQTHILRPKLKSKKINNLYFTGQLTVPGPGVPPSLISGKIVSQLIQKYHNNESTI